MDKNRGERDRLEVENPLVKMDKTPGATRDSLWVRDRQTRGEEHESILSQTGIRACKRYRQLALHKRQERRQGKGMGRREG